MKVKTLKNGLRVLLDKNDDNHDTIEIGVIILGGDNTESRRTVQYFHFLEHLLIYLTSDRWPDGRKNIKRLNRKNIKYNSTSHGYETRMYLKGNDSEVMLDMLVNAITHFKVDESIFEIEKKAIQSELSRKKEDKQTQFNDMLQKIVTPRHISAISSNSNYEAVKDVNPRDISEFIKRVIIPSRTIFYMKGAIPEYSTFKKYQQSLEMLPDIKPAFSISSLEKYRPTSDTVPGIFRIESNSSVVRVHLRWKLDVSAFDISDVVTTDIIGFCLHKILTEQLRDEFGLVYEIIVKEHFDPINNNLSYLFVETDVLSSERARVVCLEIIRMIDDFSSLFTDELVQQFIETHSARTSIFDMNVSRLLWNKDMITEKHLKECMSNANLKDIIDFANEHLNADNVYLMYNHRDDIFK